MIQLADRSYINPIGIVKNVEVLCGRTKYPAKFLILGEPQGSFYPIVFDRSFLHIVGVVVDCLRKKVVVKFGDDHAKFNFSRFANQPITEDYSTKDELALITSICIPPADPLEQYLIEHESLINHEERIQIDEAIYYQPPLLRVNIPHDPLGKTPPPPKGDPVFELKPLSDTIKYLSG